MCAEVLLGQESLSAQAERLLAEQRQEWELCGSNYRDLANVQHKQFSIGFSHIEAQWNPARLTSTSAKVDAKSISERKCFLCAQNRPKEQRSIMFGGEYTILVNPFPIFPAHFTITHVHHTPQLIEGNVLSLLRLTRALGETFVVFYNGPACGASAPDHLHFQAGSLGFLPLEQDLPTLKRTAMAVMRVDSCSLFFCNGLLRRFIVIEGEAEETTARLFRLVTNSLKKLRGVSGEPMLNILSYYDIESAMHRLVIFIREKHRPKAYFEQGPAQLMLSPAAVDLGGVCILPREEDFHKITDQHLSRIFREVFVSDEFYRELQDEISISY